MLFHLDSFLFPFNAGCKVYCPLLLLSRAVDAGDIVGEQSPVNDAATVGSQVQ
jgi:hypothetical protein